MKHYWKYIVILLLIILLPNGADTDSLSSLPADTHPDTECCCLSQAPTQTQQAIQDFYRRLGDLTLCLDGSDHHSLVPTIKYMYLWTKFLLAEGGSNSPAWHPASHPHCPPYTMARDYYILTLRKIVI